MDQVAMAYAIFSTALGECGIGANGKMTGFSAPGGLVTKRKLLAIEGAELIAEG